MLAHSKEGKLCLEDADGSVELDFSKLVSDYLLLLHFSLTETEGKIGRTGRRTIYGGLFRTGGG